MQLSENQFTQDTKIQDIMSLIDKPACAYSFFPNSLPICSDSFNLLFKGLSPAEVIEDFPVTVRMEIKENTLLQKRELKNVEVAGKKFSSIQIVPVDSNYIISFELSKPFNTDYKQIFRIIFDRSPLGIMMVDKNLKFIAVNKAVADMTGYSESELKQMTFMDITHPDDLDKNLPLTRKLYDEEIDTFSIQKRYIKKDGSIIWVNLETALAKDLNGEMIGGMGIVEDITERINIEQQRDQLLHSLREKNKEIIDSLAYARTIQNALLPRHDVFKNFFSRFFIYYKPKDVVGGDFYWIRSHGDKVFFAVADCTGHGVPGAFISLIGNYRLNLVFERYKDKDVGTILEKLNNIIAYSFRSKFAQISGHGMDMALCSYDMKTKTLEYAGANNALFLIRNGIEEELSSFTKGDEYRYFEKDLLEIRADKQSIGDYHKDSQFKTHTVSIKEGDRIYMFSDGYPDQFGGDRAKKLKMSEFKKLLLKKRNTTIQSQDQELDEFRRHWQGNLDQVDDICVIGIEF